MEYRKNHSKSYNPHFVPVTIGNYNIQINYSEITDESCLEFRHVHHDFEIYYCLEGVMHIAVGDRFIELTRNMFSIISPGVYHHTLYEPKEPKKYFVLVFEKPVLMKDGNCFTDRYVQEVIKHLETSEVSTYLDTYNCEMIIRYLEKEMEYVQPGQEDMIRAFYSQYLVHIFRNLELAPEGCVTKADTMQGNVNLALELTRYMHENYNKNISISDAAKAFHISERHVGRIFDKYFGKSFKHTLNFYRINYAKNYLIDTDYSIEKIVDIVGISSTRKFYQMFKEVENMTANEYRELHKGDISHHETFEEE